MSKTKICIDISNIIPGKGGSGGGIATYALNLIIGLNQINKVNEFNIYCIKHADFVGFDNCNNIKIINIRRKRKNIFYEIYFTNIFLPFFCIFKKIDLLHRVTPELPLIKVCKYICTLHDLMFDFYLSNKELKSFLNLKEIIKFHVFRLVAKHATYVSDTIIVPSYSIKNELIQNYKIDKNKILVTHEATQKKNVGETKNRKLNQKKINIGVVAGFYPHKGHKRVLEIAHKFIQSGFTNFEISFRGNLGFPSYIQEIFRLREKLSLNDYVFFLPFEPNVTLQEIYANFDLIMLLSEYEGFGLPVLEAQAHNIPVFCSDIPVFREILNNSAYYIGSSPDINSIKHVIKDLKTPNFLNSLALLGISNADKYSWEKMSFETIQLYKKAIKS